MPNLVPIAKAVS